MVSQGGHGLICIDYNQVAISNLMMQLAGHTEAKLDVYMLRHMILNALRAARTRFKNEFGELVICIDDRHYWRRDVFPYYKAGRRKAREESEMDWPAIFDALHQIRDELREHFPYRVIQVPGAEADDVIASICMDHGVEGLNTGEPILILSGDKDYIQLHKYANVRQYAPVLKKFIVHPDPEQYLVEHVLKGDGGDGVPSVLMPDDAIVMGTRAKPMTKKRLRELVNVEAMSPEIRRNYERNKMLIDMTQVPERIREQVRAQVDTPPKGDRKNLLKYFIDNRLRTLMDVINDF